MYTLCTSWCYVDTLMFLIILSFISDRDEKFRCAYVILLVSQSTCGYLWLPLAIYVYVGIMYYAGTCFVV